MTNPAPQDPRSSRLPLDDDEHCQVAGRVGLDDLDPRLAAAEEPPESGQRLWRIVESSYRVAADGDMSV